VARRSSTREHPTKIRLIDSVTELLETHQPHEITIEMVLQVSEVSSGSIYHHFENFPDLVDQALVKSYARFGDLQIELMQSSVDNASNAQEYERNLHEIIRITHGEGRGPMRIRRAYILAQGATRAEMRELLAVEQNRLTDGLADTIRQAQDNGWVRAELDPRVISTFVQAYGVGRVVDDVADPGVDNDRWIDLVCHVISSAMLNL
jgi:AcrR family transcriptional regulator